jgi:hypothetical protein
VLRGGDVILPQPDGVLEAGDELLFVADHSLESTIRAAIHTAEPPGRRCRCAPRLRSCPAQRQDGDLAGGDDPEGWAPESGATTGVELCSFAVPAQSVDRRLIKPDQEVERPDLPAVCVGRRSAGPLHASWLPNSFPSRISAPQLHGRSRPTAQMY